jgi:hypothetical protein
MAGATFSCHDTVGQAPGIKELGRPDPPEEDLR